MAQVMIGCVLVFAAGLFARSLHNLRNIDLGLDPRQVVVLTANPEQCGYSRERSLEFQEEWLRRARLVPGVTEASLASMTAMSEAMFAGPVTVPDAEPRSGPEPNNNINIVTHDLALLVAGAGIYGLIAYAVVRRRREIGIRLAVGAQSSDVLALFLKDVVALVGFGIAAGLPLAFATSRQFESLLYGLEPSSATTLIGAAALLTVVSAVAAGVPAKRATRVDPAGTLREV